MAPISLLLLAAAPVVKASIAIADPGDYADLKADTTDNALLADYTTDIGGPMVLTINITGPYYYTDTDASIDHTALSVNANDTSVLVATENSAVNISHASIVKEGYSTWLNEASFFGVNAAVNIANGSVSYIDHTNITTHNGAANLFAYGDGTVVYVDDVDLYSSGPVAHGLYSAGNGTIYARNVRHYAGGNRCSSFSGDSPAGYIYVTDAVAHTVGIGSAIFYTVGETYGTNVVGVAERSPSLFSDGAQKTVFRNVDFTAGLLAGTVMFSSSDRRSGASISFEDSRLTVTAAEGPGLWFGNVVADARIVATENSTVSGILVIANTSQVTQAFDHFAGSEENEEIQPAQVSVVVEESDLVGDIVAYNGSSISWSVSKHSTWTGIARVGGHGAASFNVSVDASSTWVLTGDVHLQEFRNGDEKHQNIRSRGHNIYYNPTASGNAWLKKKSLSLQGGGQIIPGST